MLIKRLTQPSIIQNEKEFNYSIPSFKRSDVEKLLSIEYVGAGVFGIESYRSANNLNTVFFCQPHFKVDYELTNRERAFQELNSEDDKISCAIFYTTKPSIFPLSMDCDESIIETISKIIPSEIDIFYQFLLVYRQDRWVERLDNQYISYLEEGVEQPSSNQFILNIQRGISRKIDDFLKWENKHYPIPEFNDKINQNGFRYNLRIVLRNGTKNQRKMLIQEIEHILNKFSYLNHWSAIIVNKPESVIEDIKSRKLDNLGKHQVLCETELIPFLVNETIEIIQDKVEEKVGNLITVNNESDGLISMLPKGGNLNTIDGEIYAKNFNHALKEIKGIRKEFKLNEVNTGTTTVKLTFVLPKGVKLSELKKKTVIEDLQIHLGVKELRIEQGSNIGEIDVYIPLENRQKVFLRDYIDTEEFREFSRDSQLPIIVGVSEIGKPIYKDLSNAPHLLVAGQTGSGKSKWFNSIITTLLLSKSPKDIQMFMIDIKQVEFHIYSNFPHVQRVITDSNEAVRLLEKLKSEMDRRYELFNKGDVKELESYNKKFPNNKMSRILVFVDEYAELKMRCKIIDEYVQSLTQLSRAAGIHLIIGTQRPSVDIISGTIKGNLPSKIVFKCANTRSYLTVLDRKPNYNLLGHGDGIMQYEGESEEHIRFQGCLIVDGDESDLIRKLSKKMKDEKIIIDLPELSEENNIDKLKRIIVMNNECRVSYLQRLMKINMNRLNDLMKQLCEEGFLKEPEYKSQGYKLIASEEEINKIKNSPTR